MKEDSTTEALKSLEQIYLKKDYGQVEKDLISLQKEIDPSLFHYNLGTIYFKKENLPLARYHLEKAWSLGFRDHRLSHNLKATKEALSVEEESSVSYDVLLLKTQEAPWEFFYLLSSIVILFFLVVLRFRKKKIKFLLTVAVLLAFSPLIFKFIINKKYEVGIVLEKVNVYEGASALFPINGTLPLGTKIMYKKGSDWSFICYPKSFAGWIKKENGIFPL